MDYCRWITPGKRYIVVVNIIIFLMFGQWYTLVIKSLYAYHHLYHTVITCVFDAGVLVPYGPILSVNTVKRVISRPISKLGAMNALYCTYHGRGCMWADPRVFFGPILGHYIPSLQGREMSCMNPISHSRHINFWRYTKPTPIKLAWFGQAVSYPGAPFTHMV